MEAKSELIYRNLAEVIGREALDIKLAQEMTLTGYIGFAPTGQIHLGYLVPCMKIRDLSLAECQIAVMIADVHAILDERKTPKDLVELRSDYYHKTLEFVLITLGADMSRIKFVRGSKFQLTGEYSMNVWDLASHVTITAAKKAGTEVVKQDKNPKLGSVIYPIMQAVDENYVGQVTFHDKINFELGGLDQRKIFCFSYDARDETDRISYLMNPIISLAKNGKMSASDPNSKLSFTDSDDIIAEKIGVALCSDGDPNCGLMSLMKCVFFPLYDNITINNIHYNNYQNLEKDFVDGVFANLQLKQTIVELITLIVAPIRDYLVSDQMQLLIQNAYA